MLSLERLEVLCKEAWDDLDTEYFEVLNELIILRHRINKRYEVSCGDGGIYIDKDPGGEWVNYKELTK